jgi:hypothetical protein
VIGRQNGGAVVYSSLSDLERRGEYRYPITGTGRLRIGHRWVVTTLIDRSCSGFQVTLKADKKRVARNQVLRFRSDAGEFLVRVVRVEDNGELGLEWIDEANSYASSRRGVHGTAKRSTLRLTACWAILCLIVAALVICYMSPELNWADAVRARLGFP